MTVFTKPAVDIFAPTDAAGNPRKVANAETQVWGTEVERAIRGAIAAGALVFGTKAELDADLNHDAGTGAWVVADPDPANNGVYGKIGPSGSGSWQWLSPIPSGDKGWSPLLRIETDSTRRVLHLYDWVGGQGTKPEETGYIGPDGLTDDISAAVDIRGPAGPSGPGTGDMLQSTYDPDDVEGNVFAGRYNVEWDGATGTGDETALIQAVVQKAYDNDLELYFPKLYTTTASIPHFHEVRKFGPGGIIRGSDTFYVRPVAGQANTLYCDASAPDDLGDGLSASQPIQQIRTAVSYLENYRHVAAAADEWLFSPAPGAYKGGIALPTGFPTRGFIKIVGETGDHVDLAINRQGATGTFQVGETVTGGTSGATGTVEEIVTAAYGPRTGAQTALVVTGTSGTFSAGETLTGGTSGATATLNAPRLIPAIEIDLDEDATAERGIVASDYTKIWLENIKFTGAFSQAVSIGRKCVYQRRNVHVDGAAQGDDIDVGSTYYVAGGIVQNCSTFGISELFGVTRSYTQITNPGEEILVRNCPRGIHVKECCRGHFDDARVEDCRTGYTLQAWSTANMRLVPVRRCDYGVVLVNSEIHNEGSMNFGSGNDACTNTVLSFGNASEITGFGWSEFAGDVTLRTGHRPLLLLASSYSQTDHTGTTNETNILNKSGVLKRGRYSVQGRRAKYVAWGTIPSTTAGTITFTARAATVLLGQVVIPSGSSGPFRVEIDMLCSADGANQFVSSYLLGDTFQDIQNAARSINLSGSDASVQFACTLANSGDTCRFNVVEVWG